MSAGMLGGYAPPLTEETVIALVVIETFEKDDGMPTKTLLLLIELTPKFPTPVIGPEFAIARLRTDFITIKSVPFNEP